MRFVVFASEEPRTPKTGDRATRTDSPVAPRCIGCPTNTGNISVTASHPWPVLASVAQALLPVPYAWNASALATGGPAGIFQVESARANIFDKVLEVWAAGSDPLNTRSAGNLLIDPGVNGQARL